MAAETLAFQAEVSRLLKIVANSLYSRKEVFLRELISNAADACDRLRYEALTKPKLIAGDPAFKVTLAPDSKVGTLTVTDNGIGMSRQELIENLGTIARSGSSAFLEQVTGDAAKDVDIIGQFGVGFYSAFIVADRVEVLSRRAGSSEAWRWSSDGAGDFEVGEAERAERGTTIVIHLKKDSREFLEAATLQETVKTHSDHIGLPVLLVDAGGKDVALNAASALWTRPKSEITKDQYREFYRHLSHGFDHPWLTVHARAEGRLEYTMLLFIPSSRPMELFQPDRKPGVRLYVKRVFVTDDVEGLVPGFLRFLVGVVDTEDISLNVSREMLQHDPILAKIGKAVVKRVLGELEKKADKAPGDFAKFWDTFGAVLKEGIYEDPERREQLLKLARFHSTAADSLTSLDEYVGRMQEGQEAIYTIAGDDVAAMRQSPQIEGYVARGAEVLLLADPVDEFWMQAVREYGGKPFASVTHGSGNLDKIGQQKPKEGGKPAPEADLAVLIALMKQALGDAVKDVRTTERLTGSPVCLVADEGDLDIHLARMLKQTGQLKESAPGILEINPRHVLIKSLATTARKSGANSQLDDAAWLLLDQARIMEGESPADAAGFGRRLAEALARTF